MRALDSLMNTDAPVLPRFRLGLLLWVAGMLGVIVLTATVLPELLRDVPLPAPSWAVTLASGVQSALIVAVAVWVGVRLAPAVGLHAHAFEAAVTARPIAPALGPQLLPGLIAGLVGGMLLLAIGRYSPAPFAEAQARFNAPLLARVLYGGITEELLLRWGLMTALVWLGWRFLRRRRGAPRASHVWLAIAVSAFLFGVGHPPEASALVGGLDVHLAAFVTGANTAFGLLFGYLFWRWGLESAMIAHALAHVVSYLTNLP